MQQSPLTLTFRSALMEQEFGRWIAQYHLKVWPGVLHGTAASWPDALDATFP
jgi:hypothetical protein